MLFLYSNDNATNGKKFCAMILQAVCKPNREFIGASTGYATVFAHSKLGHNIERILAWAFNHLKGDFAFGLTKTLRKLYQDNGRFDEDGM
jgi:hypothetical protein